MNHYKNLVIQCCVQIIQGLIVIALMVNSASYNGIGGLALQVSIAAAALVLLTVVALNALWYCDVNWRVRNEKDIRIKTQISRKNAGVKFLISIVVSGAIVAASVLLMGILSVSGAGTFAFSTVISEALVSNLLMLSMMLLLPPNRVLT